MTFLTILRTSVRLFVIAAVLLVPWSSRFTPVNDWISTVLLQRPIEVFLHKIGVERFMVDFSSDSISLYVHLGLCLVVSVVLSILLNRLPIIQKKTRNLDRVARFIGLYFLIFKLASYGLDKCLGRQFYLPAPNTLYTAFGMLDRDLLYWSTMGLAPGYSFFLGSMELLCALLMLIPKTRTLGLLATIVTLVHVVAVNFGFDISVKLLSGFLLFLSIWLFTPQLVAVFGFLTGKDVPALSPSAQHKLVANPIANRALNFFAIALILIAVIMPHWPMADGSSAHSEWHKLHGAYAVTPTTSSVHEGVKRFFFHQSGFLILQFSDDHLSAEKVYMRIQKNEFMVLDQHQKVASTWHFEWVNDDKSLILSTTLNGVQTRYVGQKLDWRALPALRGDFHWTIEGVGK